MRRAAVLILALAFCVCAHAQTATVYDTTVTMSGGAPGNGWVAISPGNTTVSIFGGVLSTVLTFGTYTASYTFADGSQKTQTWCVPIASVPVTIAQMSCIAPLTIATLGGDLQGTALSATVIGLQGHSVSNAVPTNGYSLVWSSSGLGAWTPTLLVTGTSSVFGRSGAVTAQTGDYTAAQVTNALSSTGSYASPSWLTSVAWGILTGVPTLTNTVFGRSGTVTAQTGDYTAAQVTNALSSVGATGSGAPVLATSPSLNAPSIGATPITETWTVGTGGVTANTLVQTDSSAPTKIVSATTGSYGIAQATVAASGTVQIARYGQATCVADNAVTAGDLIVQGTTTVNDCRDSGQTSSSAIVSGARLIGLAVTSASAGSPFTVELTPAHFGTEVSQINGTPFAGTEADLVSFGASNAPADSGIAAANVVTAAILDGGTDPASLSALTVSGSTSLGNAAANILTVSSAAYFGTAGTQGCLDLYDTSGTDTTFCAPGTANGYLYIDSDPIMLASGGTQVLGASNGGTGVNNSASLTLGSSNQNWGALGTGIVKNTTATGAVSDAAASDVVGLFSGTCTAATFLTGGGSCGVQVVKSILTSAYTNSTTTPSTIFSFNVAASASNIYHCHGLWSAAASGYFALAITGPSSFSLISYDFQKQNNVASGVPSLIYVNGSSTTTYPSTLAEIAVGTASTPFDWDLTVTFANGSTAGTLAFQGFTVSGDTLTVSAGSFCTQQ